jgi:hypothetical protein
MMPMDFFVTPSDEIKFDDVSVIVSSGVEEGTQLELKEALATRDGQPDKWMGDQKRVGHNARDDIAKEVVAFANAYGGIIIIGIEETEDNPKRSKQIRLPMIPRVVDCAEQLAQALRSIIDPPVPMLEVRGIVNGSDGDGVILLKVPSSPSAPHGFGRPPLAYVRRGANSEPLTMRDMQTMFFERRTRFEQVEQRRKDQSRAANEVFQKFASGTLLKPHDQTLFGTGMAGLLFRCSLVPLENMAIDNLPDRFLGNQPRRSPSPNLGLESSLVELPMWSDRWSRKYRAVEYVYCAGDMRYSRAAIHADGLIDLLSIKKDATGRVQVPLYTNAIAQGMILCEWMRRWAARPDIEYSIDCEFIVNGQACIRVDGDVDEWTSVPWNSAKFGPYSIGPRAGFSEAFILLERELWDVFGIKCKTPLNIDFEKLIFELLKESLTSMK